MKKSTGTLFLFCTLLLFACTLSCQKEEITIVSYNVANLFDGVDDGTEYKEYDPGSGKWTETLYRQKLSQIAEAIRMTVPGGPDILLLQEIENQAVLDTLVGETLADCGYNTVIAPEAPQAATTVGIASRFPVEKSLVHSIQMTQSPILREILETRLTVEGETWVIFNNHWKSKTEGAAATEAYRIAAAQLVASRVAELRSAGPDISIFVAGDLNECHDEYVRINKIYPTALIFCEESSQVVSPGACLFVSDSCENNLAGNNGVIFFEPWYTTDTGPRGSYWYAGRWESIDHILYTPGETDWRFASFHAVTANGLVDATTGIPVTWGTKNPGRGYSDHLPVVFTMTRK